MELTSSKKIETNKFELVVTVGAEEFAAAADRAFKKNASKINIPGFRKGKAPKAMVYKMYGEGMFYEDAVNELYPKAYSEAVEAAGLEPVAYPNIEVTHVDKDGFTFTAEVVVKPEVEVSDYKGIKATKAVKTVQDTEIAEDLERQRKRNARVITVEDRPAQQGDIAVIDFEGFIDGVAFDGGKGEDHSLKLGSGQFIPGFEEQVVGHSVGDAFEVHVTFPADYHEELKNKEALFNVAVKEIKEEQLPELDDEFAKDVSEFDTLEELRGSIREKLQTQKDEEAQATFENHLVDEVIANMKGEIPDEMIEGKVDEMMRDYEYRLQSQGIPMDMYLQYMGQTKDTFRDTFKESANKQVRIRLALEKVAQLENITPSEEEVEARYVQLAEQYKSDIEKIRNMVPLEDVKTDLSVSKAIDLIRDSAIVSEVPEELLAVAEGAKPAKKPATRKKAAKKADKVVEEEETAQPEEVPAE